MITRMAKTIATGFGSGYLPLAPGSWASAAILPFAIIIQFVFGAKGLLCASIILFLIGAVAVKRFLQTEPVKSETRADPSEITIDEMAAQLLVLTAADLNLYDYILAFVFFRIFDIAKPWPISLIEQRFSLVLAIMLDDIAAACYAIYFLLILKFFGAI